MQQKKIGNNTEQMLLQLLREQRYWCYLTPDKINGQPCDVIAVRDNIAWLLDSKHCKSDRFSFDRIEPNQHTCFKYNAMLGNTNTGFAIYFEKHEKWKLLKYSDYEMLKAQGYSSIFYEMEQLCELE